MADWDNWTPAQWQAITETVKLADGKAVEEAFTRISANFASGEWLTKRHIMGNPRQSLKGKNPPHNKLISSRIAEYAAASVPLHVADAWTYMGRAMAALTSGSIEVAQHLLYYAELRATHALLTRHGIMIVSGKNFVLSGSTTASIPLVGRVAYNAHQAIWLLLEQWSKLPVATEFISAQVSMGGLTLDQWVRGRPQPDSLGSVIAGLMEQWGVDLETFSRDRDLRNHLSYDPNRLRIVSHDVSPARVAKVTSELWGVLEPAAQNPFNVLDQLICRQAFEALYRRSHGVPDMRKRAYRDFNSRWVSNVLGSSVGPTFADLLSFPHTEPDPEIIKLAGRDLRGKPLMTQLAGMLGRAVILLRFATGALRDVLALSGVPTASISFWIDDMLHGHGIDIPASAPNDYSDLYLEVQEFLEDIESVLDDDSVSFADALTGFSTPFEGLSRFERVPAWSA